MTLSDRKALGLHIGTPRNPAVLESEKFRGIARNYAKVIRVKFRLPRNYRKAIFKRPPD